MKWKNWLENWNMTSLKINTPFLNMEWKPQTVDKEATWEMYIELLTRITTQPLATHHGDEKTALDSLYSLFPTTREIIRRHGRDCTEFTKIAIVVLNQIIRPFTAQWHQLSLSDGFENTEQCEKFRKELSELQAKLRIYTGMLGHMAGVEQDLASLEN